MESLERTGWKRLAEDLIRSQTTVTLATAKGDVPWAAPVYYVNLGFFLYFFSSPESRHIQESASGAPVAAAIYCPASAWQDIRGVQMSGRIAPVPLGPQALRAFAAYMRKYPFTAHFFEAGQRIDLGSLTKRFRVRLYRFEPDLVYYLDNSIRFGFREEVPLQRRPTRRNRRGGLGTRPDKDSAT